MLRVFKLVLSNIQQSAKKKKKPTTKNKTPTSRGSNIVWIP